MSPICPYVAADSGQRSVVRLTDHMETEDSLVVVVGQPWVRARTGDLRRAARHSAWACRARSRRSGGMGLGASSRSSQFRTIRPDRIVGEVSPEPTAPVFLNSRYSSRSGSRSPSSRSSHRKVAAVSPIRLSAARKSPRFPTASRRAAKACKVPSLEM